MVRAAKGKAITLPKTMNYFTGKNTKNVTGIQWRQWGEGQDTLHTWSRLIKNLKDDAKFNAVIRGAMEFAKFTSSALKTQLADHVTTKMKTKTTSVPQLVDRSDSGSDDDDDE